MERERSRTEEAAKKKATSCSSSTRELADIFGNIRSRGKWVPQGLKTRK